MGRDSLGAFRTFVRFALVWFYLFPLPLGVREGLRFVIVALPGLFSYPFYAHPFNLPTGDTTFPVTIKICAYISIFNSFERTDLAV